MTTTDVLALIGAVTGIVGTMLALSALGWDFYKWRYSERVRLQVSAFPNFRFYNPALSSQSQEDLLWVSATNVGKIRTSIKLLSFHGFDSKWHMRKRNGHDTAVVMTPLHGSLPAKLEPGDDWAAGVSQKNFEKYLKYKYFVVQFEDSMSDFPFRAIVDKSRMLEK